MNCRVEQDDGFLPNISSFLISHVMDFIKYNPADLSGDLGASVQHGAQDLRGHDEARGIRINCDVTGHETNIRKFFTEIPILLITKRFNRSSVYNSLFVGKTHGDGILGNHSLTS